MSEPSTSLARLIAFCEQVAHDGFLPSLAWFTETAETLRHVEKKLREAASPPPTSTGWEYTHERDGRLIASDGWMCEQHPGREWPHDDCAGPGMPWLLQGKQAIVKLAEQASTPPTDPAPTSRATGHKVIRCPHCKEFGSHLKECTLDDKEKE